MCSARGLARSRGRTSVCWISRWVSWSSRREGPRLLRWGPRQPRGHLTVPSGLGGTCGGVGGGLTCPHLTPAREAAAAEPSRWASGAAGTAVGSGSGMSTVRPERRSAGPTPGLWRGWRVLRQPRYPHRKACFGTMNAERAGSLSHRGVSILWTQVLPEGVSGGRPQG